MSYISREEAIEKIKAELTTAKLMKNKSTTMVLERILAAIGEVPTFTDSEAFNKLWMPGFKIQPGKVNIKDLINAINEDTDLDIEDEATGNYISATAGNSIIEKLPNGTVQKIEGTGTITIKVLFDGGETWEK